MFFTDVLKIYKLGLYQNYDKIIKQKSKKCWFCDRECFSFVSICSYCKDERRKSSVKK